MSPKSVKRFWVNDMHQNQWLKAGRANLNSRDTLGGMMPTAQQRSRHHKNAGRDHACYLGYLVTFPENKAITNTWLTPQGNRPDLGACYLRLPLRKIVEQQRDR